jgi:hypothetical protein
MAKGNTFLTRKERQKNPKGIKELKPCPEICPKCGEGHLGSENLISCKYDCTHVIKRAEL